MKITTLRRLFFATLVVVGFIAVLPVSAARAPRPPSTVTPPVPVSGM